MKKTNRKWVTAFLMLSIFLTAIEATIVATAMPTIVGKLGGFSLFTWVFSMYFLTQAVTVPIYGKIADLYGRKYIFIAGTGIFITGSALSGLAHTMPQLIAFRGIQGLGAGAVLPIALTIIGDLYPGVERARVQGLLSSVWAIAAIIGPALGGIIVQTIGWPWIFEVNVPLGILAVLGITFFLHERVERHEHKIDYLGALTMAVGVGSLLIALMQGGTKWAWSSIQEIILLTIAVIFLGIFIRVEKRAQEPVISFSLMRQHVVSVTNLCAIITGGLTIGATSFFPTFSQGVLGTSAMIAGATIVPLSIGWPIASTLSARLMWRFGYRNIEIAGMLFCILASLMYLAINPSSQPQYMALCSLIMGVGLGLTATTQLVAIQTSVSWQHRGIATGSIMFSRILGSTLLVSMLGTIINTSIVASLRGETFTRQYMVKDSVSVVNLLLDPSKRSTLPYDHLHTLTGALANGIHLTFWVILIVSIVGLFLSLRMPAGVPDENGRVG